MKRQFKNKYIAHQVAVIILAAGRGKRMKSKIPKVLHQIGNASIIMHALGVVKSINPAQIILVCAPKSVDRFKKIFKSQVDFATQKRPLGTANATYVGLKEVRATIKTILVLYGADLAFFQPQTLKRVIKQHIGTNSVQTLVVSRITNPTGFGRIIRKKGKIVDIVEEKEATANQRKIKEVNVGIYTFDKNWLINNLAKIKPSAVTGENYLVDLVKIATKTGKKTQTYMLKDPGQWLMIDNPNDLELASQKLIKRIHIMGIAGAGASSITQIALKFGYEVTGCDISPKSSYTSNFPIAIEKGHAQSHILAISKLVISPAILKFDPNNPELREAKKKGIDVMTWQKFQGQFLQRNKYVIAVAGAYGKSTTTAMIAKILSDCNFDPTCEIGAILLDWSRNYRVGNSEYYVCEADEYNDNFLNYKPEIAIILNTGWDHPDYFKSKKSVLSSYKKFISGIKKGGHLIISQRPDLESLAKFARSDIKVVKIKNFEQIKLSIIGDFRKENASTALTVAQVLGIDLNSAKKSLANFKGLARRLEHKGEIKGTKIFDDYAVQPYTIKTTANALSDNFKNQNMALIFEPHTFSRIKNFFTQFAKSLKEVKAKKIFITEVYAARERANSSQIAKSLAQKVGSKAEFSGSVEQTAANLGKHLSDFDIICSMGAGNVYKLYDLLRG